jgi:hypothetical protein
MTRKIPAITIKTLLQPQPIRTTRDLLRICC